MRNNLLWTYSAKPKAKELIFFIHDNRQVVRYRKRDYPLFRALVEGLVLYCSIRFWNLYFKEDTGKCRQYEGGATDIRKNELERNSMMLL